MNAPANSKQHKLETRSEGVHFSSQCQECLGMNVYILFASSCVHTFCFLVNRLFLAPPEGCSFLPSKQIVTSVSIGGVDFFLVKRLITGVQCGVWISSL